MFRSISETPDVFGSVQGKIQSIISTLIAVSSTTKEYHSEGRIDADTKSNLANLMSGCQDTLGRLEDLKHDFERWGMQSVRGEEIQEMTNTLDNQIQELLAINNTIGYYAKEANPFYVYSLT